MAGILVALSRLAAPGPAALPGLDVPLAPLPFQVRDVVALLAIPGLAVAGWAWWRNPSVPETAAVAGLVALVAARIVADPPVLVAAAWSGTILVSTPRPARTDWTWDPKLLVGGILAILATLLALQPWGKAPAPLTVALLVIALGLGRALAVRMRSILGGAAFWWGLGVLVPLGAMLGPASAPLVVGAAALESLGCWLAARWELGPIPWAVSSLLGLGVLAWR